MLTYIPIEAISAILGALVGGWATYRLAIDVAHRTALHARELADMEAVRNAGNNLCAAFAPQRATIRRDQSKSAADIQKLLELSIDTVTIEMEKFRFYITENDLPLFDKACEEYQDVARIRAMNYSTLGGKEPFKVFEAKVDAILRFTKT